MARPSTLLMPNLPVPIVTGQDALWLTIRTLDKKGPWSIYDIDDSAQRAVITTIEDYIRRLRRGGYIEIVGERKNGKHNTATNLYRIKIKQAETPRLRQNGDVAPPSGQMQMWRAMRSLPQFNHAELAYGASTDEVKVSNITAKTYVQRLADAGFLQLIAAAKTSGGLAIWRLKRSMNSGPLAPQVLRTRFIFDPNRKAIVGTGDAAENDEVIR